MPCIPALIVVPIVVMATVGLTALVWENEKREARETNDLCNDGRGKLIVIGVRSGSSFTPEIYVCLDPNTLRTFWAKHLLRPTKSSTSSSSATWLKDYFEKVNPEQFYKFSGIDKGHLAPVADFSTPIEQKMTYYYINAAPQATSLNRGNWRTLESKIRRKANSEESPVLVITGTGGVTQILNSKINYPFPEYFFKVAVFSSNDVVLYFGANNDGSRTVGQCVPYECLEPLKMVSQATYASYDILQELGIERSDVNYTQNLPKFGEEFDPFGHDDLRRRA